MAVAISRDWTVQRTLKENPQLIPILIRLKTGCTGCWLERFCTLQDVSQTYDIPIKALLEALPEVVIPIGVEEEER